MISHFDDEAMHWLAPGERLAWQWGGGGPLELSIAVGGETTVSAGAVSTHVASNQGEYALGQLRVEDGGAEAIEVCAGPAGAHVTDLAVTAR